MKSPPLEDCWIGSAGGGIVSAAISGKGAALRAAGGVAGGAAASAAAGAAAASAALAAVAPLRKLRRPTAFAGLRCDIGFYALIKIKIGAAPAPALYFSGARAAGSGA